MFKLISINVTYKKLFYPLISSVFSFNWKMLIFRIANEATEEIKWHNSNINPFEDVNNFVNLINFE